MDITELKGIGEKRAGLYRKLGVEKAEQLLTYYPRDYVDFSEPCEIAALEPEQTGVFKAVVSRRLKPYIGPKYSIYKAIAADSTGEILLTFFNSQFTFERLLVGKEYLFYGKITGSILARECRAPVFIPSGQGNLLMPKYHLTAGLTGNMVISGVKAAMEKLEPVEPFPDWLLEKYALQSYPEALQGIHFPANKEALSAARKRLAFQELMVLRLGLALMKSRNERSAGIPIPPADMKGFYGSLPFKPTGAQVRAVKECITDLSREVPMNRLLQGDVGSGKTLVAAACCYDVIKNGYQAALMAPTEILAKQHYKTLTDFLQPLGINVTLLTGSLSQKEKNEARSRLLSGEANLAVGTHALIQGEVAFKRLGLAITDEQHRFGVRQRGSLASKGENPHRLVMSATPIPRTLALMIYGELDISVLDEMPKGRKPVLTYCVDGSFRPRLYKFILKNVREGRQAYIICPLVEEGETDKSSVAEYLDSLKNTCIGGLNCGMLHGKMRQEEKDRVMLAFKAGEISVLVATTVVEVGVDVPNASVMIIENAEQFGLSQLHQLRGRVGRGCFQSYCVLVSDDKSEYAKSRMEIMKKTSDGFQIANQDLALRGPGNFFGAMQHGLPPLKSAAGADPLLVEQAGEAAELILKSDPALKKPENNQLRILVKELFEGNGKIETN